MMPYDIIIGRNEKEQKELGNRGLIFYGKSYVKMGQTSSLSNNIFIDVAKAHTILISGKKGSGKSYSIGVFAEEIANLQQEVSKNLSVLIFDTMGIFWTMKYPNYSQVNELSAWGLEPKGLPVKVYAPSGKFHEYKEKKIAVDYSFSIMPSELTAEDWCNVFQVKITDSIGVLIEKTLTKLKSDYDINDIIFEIRKDNTVDQLTKNATENRFQAVKNWGLFDIRGFKVKDLVKGGQVSILDLSAYDDWNIKSLVVGIVSKKLFNERVTARKQEETQEIEYGQHYLTFEREEKQETPLVWLFIDECLSQDVKIITDIGLITIKNVVEKFGNNKDIKVLSFNHKENKYEFKEITKVYKIPKRKIIRIRTECGNEIRCTPDHPILNREGYISAINAKELSTSLIYQHYKEKKLVIARLCGHILGDGYLSEKTKSVGFSGKGNDEDLLKIKEDLSLLNLKSSNIHTRITSSNIIDEFGKNAKVIGVSQEMVSSIKAFKFFRDLNLPIGEKVLSNKKIPSWILNSSKDEKAEFLAALMGSDGHGLGKAKNSKIDFNAIRLSFNKADYLEKDAWKIAFQITGLFNDLDIKVSNIKKRYGNLRKDGIKTIKIVITLAKNIGNTIKFLEKIGFRYNKKKEINAKKWLAYLKCYKNKLNNINKIRQNAFDLKNQGYKNTAIGEILKLPKYRIETWFNNKNKSALLSHGELEEFEMWSRKRVYKEILYENIEEIELCNEEDVYDISVKDNHNFIANGFIVHNCHEFLPDDKKTPAMDDLIQLIREGRQPGISLVMATQQPGKIHRDVITQSDIVISHRVTAKPDIEALNTINQTYLTSSILANLNNLPKTKGAAIILDDNSERIYSMKVRPKMSWHGGDTPSAVKIKKQILQI